MSSGRTSNEFVSSRANTFRSNVEIRISRLVVLLIAIGVAYSLGYWQNQETDTLSNGKHATGSCIGFEPGEVHLGDQPWGRDAPFEFCFANREGGDVVVDSVGVSCDCARLQDTYEGHVVAPGSVLTIQGTLDLGLSLGPVRRELTLMTVGGRMFHGSLTANVVPTFTLSPSALDFGNIGDEGSRTELVEFRSERVGLLDTPTCDSEWLSVECIRRDGGYDIMITADPDRMLHGYNWGRVVFVTDDAYVNEYALVVRGATCVDRSGERR